MLALVAVVVAAFLGPSSAYAGTGWSGPTQIGASSSVSCPSSSFCMTVGSNGQAQMFNGSSWSAPVTIDTRGLVAVSCTSSSFCAAVDTAQFSDYALTFDGSSWSAPVQIDTTRNSMSSVSCASSSFCIATDVGGNGFTYNGTSWAGPSMVNYASNQQGTASVSCPSSSFCAAVGGHGNAEIFNGSSWSSPAIQVANGLASVSCTSSSFCVAVDGNGSAYTYNGSSWSAPVSFDPAAGGLFASVSCTSSSFCAAIDRVMHVSTFNGSSWSAPLNIQPGSSLRPTVSCASSSFCVAVDGAGDAYTYGTVQPPPTPGAPTVSPGAPTVAGSGSAGFSGSVVPDGLATTAYFQYGLDPRYTGGGALVYDQSTPSQPVASDFTTHPVSASASGLVPNALYHVRLVASNGAGTTTGPDQTFTTAADPPPPPPVLGKEANFAPVSGTVYVKPPGLSGHAHAALTKGTGFIPLTEARQLPVGTQVDARQGTLSVTTATGAARKGKRTQTQTAEFSLGLFEVLQSTQRRVKGLTIAKMLDSGLFPGAPSYKTACPAVGKTINVPSATEGKSLGFKHRGLSHKVVQALGVTEHGGNYQARGKYSAGSVRGTIFTVTDRCDGTLTTVKRGTVIVTAYSRPKQPITLHAHQSFLAKAP